MLQLVDDESMPKLVESWCAHQGMRGFSSRTVGRRRWSLGKLACHLDSDLITCTGLQLEGWLSTYPGIQTRYSLRADVHQFFIWAIRRGYAVADPTIEVDPPRLPKRLPSPVPTIDVERLIAHCTGDDLAMVLLASHAGLRVSEIAHLHARDIQESCVYVRAGKGARDRSVPLSNEVLAALPARAHDLFPGMIGQTVSDHTRARMRKLGIQHRPHDLRHSFGTELARRGTPIEVIAQLMGHESLATTKGYILLAAPNRAIVEGMYRRAAA